MLGGFLGNLIFAIIARMLCGNHLKRVNQALNNPAQHLLTKKIIIVMVFMGFLNITYGNLCFHFRFR